MLRALLFSFFLLFSVAVHAESTDAPLADAAGEARARALFYEFRCLSCAGESIADSPADIAAALRASIRRDITDGKTDEYIRARLRAAYGERILMDPPVTPSNALLWAGPFLLLAIGTLLLRRTLKARP